jgi:hypothetical protein
MSYAAPKIFLHRNAIAWRGLGSFDQNLPVLARASAWQKNPIKLTRWPVRLTTRQAVEGLIYFRVRPTWVPYSDFRQNPANIVTLNWPTSEETHTVVPFRGDAPY